MRTARTGCGSGARTLLQEVAALQADADAKDTRSDEAAATLRALRGKGDEAEEARLRLAAQRKKLADEAAKAAQLPDKAAKQLALVSSMHAQVRPPLDDRAMCGARAARACSVSGRGRAQVVAQHADAAAQLEQRDGDVQRRAAAVRQLENECTLLMGEQERASYGVEAWQQSIDSVGKEVAMKRLEAEHILSEQARPRRHTRSESVCCALTFRRRPARTPWERPKTVTPKGATAENGPSSCSLRGGEAASCRLCVLHVV